MEAPLKGEGGSSEDVQRLRGECSPHESRSHRIQSKPILQNRSATLHPPQKKDRGSGKLGTANDQNKQLIHLLRPWIMINLRIHSTRARKTRMSFYTAQDGSTRDLKKNRAL
ncbi:hypothetical protein PGTUg99_024808 [Puccinia graminis f. sp. tritici]|uniref:Uncharacterized protein n=1 Tax=Puccinia graminis f. sp. tritici TaxID=56615 RepID=A0A5B0PPP2_PUCGR|nr:hypothetical protein PGTUg99_024808 [Puccinia graminis f. sp. tritici]